MEFSKQTGARAVCFDATALIQAKLSYELLLKIAVSGSLRTSPCRSVVWRLLLRCLPYEQSEWETVLSRNRNAYRMLKKKNITNPHDERFSQDPQLNNPLAPLEQNPWHKFFEDSEIRDIIGKDVSRTLPEIELFQQDHIRKMMSDILLIYAKENPFVLYKQGMHEILAPLIFVIYSDLQSYQHAKENGELNCLTVEEEDVLNCVFSWDYIEHDSFNMFCELMLEVVKWYEEPAQSPVQRKDQGPFMRIQDAPATSRLMADLTEIGHLLEETDPTLARHLSALDIPPQLYGIRWLRLLFGRELPLHDLLYLWDILLIDRPMAPLIQCVFVSMLVQIRHLLITSDYGGCLQYLMRYPPIADIDAFIQLARHYHNPKKIARPNVTSNNFSHITVAGKNHPNRDHRPTHLKDSRSVARKAAEDSPPSVLARPLAPSAMLEKMKNTIRERSNSASMPSTPRKNNTNSKKASPVNNASPKMEAWGKEILLMEEQVSCLQTRLNERDLVCSQVARALEACARDVAQGVPRDNGEAFADRLRELSRMLTVSSVAEHAGHAGIRPTPSSIDKGREVREKRETEELTNRSMMTAINEMVQFTSSAPKM